MCVSVFYSVWVFCGVGGCGEINIFLGILKNFVFVKNTN